MRRVGGKWVCWTSPVVLRLFLSAEMLLFAFPASEVAACTAHDSSLSSIPDATAAPDRVAFEFHYFERSVDATDLNALRGVGPPRWSDEDIAKLDQGERVPPPGMIMHGIMWADGDGAFCAQWVDPLQRQIGKNWDGIGNAEAGYRFPRKAVNLCGKTDSFSWFGPGFGSVRVAPNSDRLLPVGSWVRQLDRVRLLTTAPETLLARNQYRVIEKRQTESSRVWLWTDDAGTRDGMIIHRLDANSMKVIGWESYEINHRLGEGTVAKMMRVKSIDATRFQFPDEPSDVPEVLVGVADQVNLGFTNYTDDTSWSALKVSHRRQSSSLESSAAMWRIPIGIAVVVLAAALYMRRRHSQTKEKAHETT